MIQQIKQLRIKIDGLTELTQSLDKSREIALTITSLQLTKMWLGKILGELGQAHPYPESTNPSNEIIEAAVDKYSLSSLPLQDNNMKDYFSVTDQPNIHWYNNFTHIQKVKWLRGELKSLDSEIFALLKERVDELPEENADKAALFMMYCYKSYTESVMWLGTELGRIHEEGKK